MAEVARQRTREGVAPRDHNARAENAGTYSSLSDAQRPAVSSMSTAQTATCSPVRPASNAIDGVLQPLEVEEAGGYGPDANKRRTGRDAFFSAMIDVDHGRFSGSSASN